MGGLPTSLFCHEPPLLSPPHCLVAPPPVTTRAEYRPPCSGRRASCFATGPLGVTVRGLVRIIIHLRRQVVVVCIP
jgi:hypothetical protein